MRESFRLLWLFTVLVLITACTPARIRAQGIPEDQIGPARFSLTISAEESTVKAGSPVWIDDTLQNTADYVISLWDRGGQFYKVDVRDQKGAAVQPTEFGKCVQAQGPNRQSCSPTPADIHGGVLLRAGEKATHRINIGRLFDLSQPGTYTIHVSKKGANGIVKSNTITVTVISPTPVSGSAQGTAPPSSDTISAPQMEVKVVPLPPRVIPDQTHPQISMTISAVNSTVKAGSPVLIDVVLANILSQTIYLGRIRTTSDDDDGGWNDWVDVWDAKGATAPQTEVGKRIQDPMGPGVAASVSTLILEAGTKQTDRVNVSKLYDLSQPGTYTIQVRRMDHGGYDRSNKITVTVIP